MSVPDPRPVDPRDHYTGGDPRTAVTALQGILEQAITGTPRTQQKRIGPSEIGTPCTRCLAHKLNGTPVAWDVAWLPTIGTAVHTWAEDAVKTHNTTNPDARFATETNVSVGHINDTEIRGTCDVFDITTGTVIDYKVVGKTTLDKARRHGPTPTYRVQAHLYGRGWARKGFTVAHVAIWYLPRTSPHLAAGVLWTQPYDEQVAVDALTRADALARALDTLGIEQLAPLLPTDPDCHDCARYTPQPEQRPVRELHELLA